MPRTLVRAHTDEDRSKSLGWLALAWMEYFVVHGPGDVQGELVTHGDEYTGFIVDCYMVGDEPSNNHMLYDSAFLSRPKGCDKSGLGARLALFEGLGPCRFTGEYAKGGEVYRDPWGLGFRYVYEAGEPMGRPVQGAFIRCLATEESQVGNVYATIYYNLTQDEDDPPLSYVPNVDCGVDKVLLPNGGQIRVSTASSAAKDGGKETFARPPTARRRGAGQGMTSPSSMKHTSTRQPSSSACTGPSPGTCASARSSAAAGS